MKNDHFAPDKVPVVPEALVAWLERTFPPRCLERDEEPRHAHRYAGKVELVAFLRRTAKAQVEGGITR